MVSQFRPDAKHSICCLWLHLLHYSLFCSSNTYTQHRRDDIKFLLFTVFSVENTKTPTSSTGSKTQCLFGEQVPESISRDDYEKSPGYWAIFSKLFIFSAWKVMQDILGDSFSVSKGKYQYVNSANCLDTDFVLITNQKCLWIISEWDLLIFSLEVVMQSPLIY